MGCHLSRESVLNFPVKSSHDFYRFYSESSGSRKPSPAPEGNFDETTLKIKPELYDRLQ